MSFESFYHDKLVGVGKNLQRNKEEIEREVSLASSLIGEKKFKDELEKSSRDLELIKFVRDAVASYLSKYGRLDVSDIPLERIHLLPAGAMRDDSRLNRFEHGAHSVVGASVVVERAVSDVDFCQVLFHELFHNYSYSALQIIEKEGSAPKLRPYRSGISVYSRDGKKIYFQDLEEAVVGFMERKFYKEYISDSALIESVGSDVGFSRSEELNKLEGLADEVCVNLPEEYPIREEVFEVVIRAQITGNILPFARMIEKAFGKGSFRIIAEENSTSA